MKTKLVLTKRFTRGVLEGITIQDTFTARTAAEVERMFNLVGKRIATCTNADYEVQAVRYAEQPDEEPALLEERVQGKGFTIPKEGQ